MADGQTSHASARKLITQYCRGRANLLNLLRALPEPRGPALTALLHLREAHLGEYPAEQALEEARGLPLSELADPDLAILFFATWSDLCLFCDRLDEAEMLIHRAEALISPQTPPEVAAFAVEHRGLLEGKKGNKQAREKSYQRALSMLKSDSGRRRFLIYNRAIFLAEQGRAMEVAADVVDLEASTDEALRPGHVAAVRFIDAVETGRLDDAQLVRAVYERDDYVVRMAALTVPSRGAALELMLGRWQDSPGEESNDALWARSTQRLLDRQPEEALRRARAYAEAEPQAHLQMGFQSLTLIRAEMANGNAMAAMRLLGQRWAAGYRNYLDDFFVGRAALLRGDRKAAAWYMQTAVEAVERYEAVGRLDFEARLALEMSPAEVVKLLPLGGRKAGAPRIVASKSEEVRGTGRLLGSSPAMAAVRQAVERFAAIEVPVLITGETGTGKELVARAIHECGPRSDEPFVAVNCGAITDTLLESELFGHEKGAFTGAVGAHKGLFEGAGKGTLLLDEIGEISSRLQVVLLRVLETSEVRPVGSARTRKVFCRVIASTNADLGSLVAARRFREDLMFRLKRLEIRIPPLRERREDILVLAESFLREGRPAGAPAVMSPELLGEIRRRDWPGNVRELRNSIERMRLLNSDKPAFGLRDLDPDRAASGAGSVASGDPQPPPPTAPSTDSVEDILLQSRNPMRRRDRLRKLFEQHRKLTRREICLIMKISHNTASADLKRLCEEDFIEKIKPSASPRSHYFALRSERRDQPPA